MQPVCHQEFSCIRLTLVSQYQSHMHPMTAAWWRGLDWTVEFVDGRKEGNAVLCDNTSAAGL